MFKSKKVLLAIGVIALLVVACVVYFFFFRDSDAVANAPKGCPKSTSIVVTSKEAGTQKINTSNSNFLHWGKDQGRLVFSNYEVDVNDIYENITEGRVLTVIKLQNNDLTELGVGTYRKAPEEGTTTPNLYTPEYNISTVGLAGGVFDNKATVNITYFGKDYVCGSVTSDDGRASIKGEFIAKYIDKL